MNISDNIKEQLKLKRTSNRAMSKAIGMSESGFYAALKNNSFKIESLQKIADTLKINVDKLLDINDKTTAPKGSTKTKNAPVSQSGPKQEKTKTSSFYQKRNSLSELINKKTNATDLLNSIIINQGVTSYINHYFGNYIYYQYGECMDDLDEMISQDKSTNEILEHLVPRIKEIVQYSKIDLKKLNKLNTALIGFYRELAQLAPDDDLKGEIEMIEMVING